MPTKKITSIFHNGEEYELGGDSGITKIFTLSSTSDLTNAQAAYDWWVNGGNPIIEYGSLKYHIALAHSSAIMFTSSYGGGAMSTNYVWGNINTISFVLSNGTVTSITSNSNKFNVRTSAPASGTTNSEISFVI